MNAARKKRFIRMAFLLNGLLFLLGGLDFFGDDKLFLGMLEIFAGMLNLAMLRKAKPRAVKEFLGYAILLMNVVVALSIAIDYFQMGKSYIQYMWLAAAAMSLIAFFIHFRKKKGVNKKAV